MEELASSSSLSPGSVSHPMMGQAPFPLVSFPSAGEDVEDDSIFSTDDQTSSQDDQMFLGIRSPSSLAGGAASTRSPDKKDETGDVEEEEEEEEEDEFEDARNSGQTYQELY